VIYVKAPWKKRNLIRLWDFTGSRVDGETSKEQPESLIVLMITNVSYQSL